MLRLWLFLIFVFVFHALSVFATVPINNGQNFCGALVSVVSEQKRQSDSTLNSEKIKALLIPKNPGAMPTGESFTTLVELVKDLQKNDSTDETNPSKIDVCKEKYSQLLNSNTADFLMPDWNEQHKQDDTTNESVEPTAVTKIYSNASFTDVHSQTPAVHDAPNVDDCEELWIYRCDVEQNNFEQLMSYLNNLEKSKQCKCLPEKLKIIYGTKYNDLKNEAKKALEEAVEQKLAKKVLNDFSSYFEDVSFFAATSKDFFGKKSKDQTEKAMELRCVDSRKYNKAIDDKCKGKISEEQRQKRIDNIFNGFGEKKSNIKLDKRFNELMTTIERLDAETVDKKGTPYTRQDHDKARHSLALTDQQFIFADQLIKKIVSDTTFHKAISESSEVPFFVITKLLDQKIKENPSKFLNDFIDPKVVGNDYYKAFSKLLSNPDSFSNAIKVSISASMGLHPGIDSIMRDKSLLFSVVDDAKKKNKSLMKTLEDKDSLLLANYENECKKFIDSFASAVCLDVEDIPTQMSEEDIYSVLGPYSKNNEFNRLLACESSQDGTQEPLKNLLLNDPSKKNSDFLDRMTNPIDKQTNAFRKMFQALKEKDEDLSSRLFNSFRVTGFSSGVDSDFFEEKSSGFMNSFVSNNLNGTELSPIKNEISSNLSSKDYSSELEKNEVVPELPKTNLLPSQVDYSSKSQIERNTISERKTSSSDLREEFRDSFMNDKNKDKIDEFMPKADDSMLKELLKLREENSKAQERLNQILAQQENLKLKELEAKIKSLEEKKKQLEEPVTTTKPIVRSNISGGNNFYPRDSVSDFSSKTPQNTNHFSSNHSGTTTNGESAQFRSARVASSGSSFSSALRQKEPFVISSSEKSLGVEVKPRDISAELLKYIDKNSPDSSTLLKIRGSDIVYKYKVIVDGEYIEKEVIVDYKSLHPDVKKMIDDKLIAQGVDLKKLDQIDNELNDLKRKHTYSSLKSIILDTIN
jgi:hypothetical protein